MGTQPSSAQVIGFNIQYRNSILNLVITEVQDEYTLDLSEEYSYASAI